MPTFLASGMRQKRTGIASKILFAEPETALP